MTARTKLWIALLVAVSMIGVVTVLANTIYLPVIEKSPTITPTNTATITPTATKTPSATPTRTATPEPGVYIVDIVYDPPSPLDEYIELENTRNNSVNMDGWWIKADSGARYDFGNFTLGGKDTVRIWTKSGTDTDTNLYMDRTTQFWNDNSDVAYLRDEDGNLMDTYSY